MPAIEVMNFTELTARMPSTARFSCSGESKSWPSPPSCSSAADSPTKVKNNPMVRKMPASVEDHFG